MNFHLIYLNSFFGWLIKKSAPEIIEGNNITQQILLQIIGLFRQPPEKRTAISRGYLKKFNKTFLYGLSKIASGLRIAFRPELISYTRIDDNQLRRFILDDREGLGTKYLFNKVGTNSVPKILKELERRELIVAERLLLNPSQARTTRNGWVDLGMGEQPIRILIRPRSWSKDWVCFLCKTSNHREYDERLNIPADKFPFRAA